MDDSKQDLLFNDCAATVRTLLPALIKLSLTALLQPAPLAGREWFELLRQKLIPQLGEQAFLVVAVVGGTNIGNRFLNHLAGSRASATSPLASGTKHATCLVPEGFDAQHNLQDVFPDFELHKWSDAALGVEECDTHRLFCAWRRSCRRRCWCSILPTSIVMLASTGCADAVRRSADVLIAVLTQQKYNDAAVKEFFRKAGDEDKAVLVVFNQCLLPERRTVLADLAHVLS